MPASQKGDVVLELGLNVSKALVDVRKQIQQHTPDIEIKKIRVDKSGVKSLELGITRVSSSAKVAQKSIRDVAKETKTATGFIEDFAAKSALAFKRYTAFTAATFAFRKITSDIGGAIDQSIKFERELVRISQLSEKPIASLRGLSDAVFDISTSMGVSSSELLKSSRILKQAGFSIGEIQGVLKTLAKTDLAPNFKNLNDTTEASIAIMNQFKIEVQDLDGALDSINKTSSVFAFDAQDITAAVKRAGSTFASAGGQFDQFLSVFGAIRQQTRQAPETIATSLRTLVPRLQRTSTGNLLESFGISVRDSDKQFIGPLKAIEAISKGIKEIGDVKDPRVFQIIEQLGGLRRIESVLPLITNFEKVQEVLNAARSKGNSLDKDAVDAQQALEIQLKKLTEEFNKLFFSIEQNEAIRGFITQITELTTNLLQLANFVSNNEVLSALFITGGALGALSVGGKVASGLGVGKILGRNSGGPVPGRGPNRDDKLIAVTGGEYVLNRKSVDRIGISNLEKMNQLGQVPGFVRGGYVLREGFRETIGKNGQSYYFDSSGTRVSESAATTVEKTRFRDVPILGGESSDSSLILPEVPGGSGLVLDDLGRPVTSSKTPSSVSPTRNNPRVNASLPVGLRENQTQQTVSLNRPEIQGPKRAVVTPVERPGIARNPLIPDKIPEAIGKEISEVLQKDSKQRVSEERKASEKVRNRTENPDAVFRKGGARNPILGGVNNPVRNTRRERLLLQEELSQRPDIQRTRDERRVNSSFRNTSDDVLSKLSTQEQHAIAARTESELSVKEINKKHNAVQEDLIKKQREAIRDANKKHNATQEALIITQRSQKQLRIAQSARRQQIASSVIASTVPAGPSGFIGPELNTTSFGRGQNAASRLGAFGSRLFDNRAGRAIAGTGRAIGGTARFGRDVTRNTFGGVLNAASEARHFASGSLITARGAVGRAGRNVGDFARGFADRNRFTRGVGAVGRRINNFGRSAVSSVGGFIGGALGRNKVDPNFIGPQLPPKPSLGSKFGAGVRGIGSKALPALVVQQITGAIGSGLEERGRNLASQGKIGEGVDKTLTGAAVGKTGLIASGAVIGSAFGPVGTVVGGAVGALGAFATEFEGFNKVLNFFGADVKTTSQKLEELSDIQKDYEKGLQAKAEADKKQVEANKKLKEISEAIVAGREKEIQSIRNSTAVLSSLGAGLRSSSGVLNNLDNTQLGSNADSLSTINAASSGTLGFNEFGNLRQILKSSVGGIGPQGAAIERQANIEAVSNKIAPNIIDRAIQNRDSSTDLEGVFTDALEQGLRDSLINTSRRGLSTDEIKARRLKNESTDKDIKTFVTKLGGRVFSNDAGQDAKNLLPENRQKLVQSATVNDSLQSAAEAFKIQQEKNKILSGLFDKRIKLETSIAESENKTNERLSNLNIDAIGSLGGDTSNLRVQSAFGNLQSGLKNVTGFDRNDLGSLASRRAGAEGSLRRIKEGVIGTPSDKQREAAEKQIAIINKTNRAFELLANNTTVAASLEGKLNKLRSDRQAANAFATNAAFATDAERQKIGRGVALTAKVAQGNGSLAGIASEDRALIQQTLSAFSDTQRKAFGKNEDGSFRTGKQLSDLITLKFSGGTGEGITKPTLEEEQTQAALGNVIKTQGQAGKNALTAGGSPKDLASAAEQINQNFIKTVGDNLSAALNANIVKPLVEALNNIPETINVEFNNKIEVVFNGAQTLSNLQPTLEAIAIEQARVAINNHLAEIHTDAPSVPKTTRRRPRATATSAPPSVT